MMSWLLLELKHTCCGDAVRSEHALKGSDAAIRFGFYSIFHAGKDKHKHFKEHRQIFSLNWDVYHGELENLLFPLKIRCLRQVMMLNNCWENTKWPYGYLSVTELQPTYVRSPIWGFDLQLTLSLDGLLMAIIAAACGPQSSIRSSAWLESNPVPEVAPKSFHLTWISHSITQHSLWGQ